MRINDQDWSFIDVIRAFFPFRLFIAHLKLNLFSLVFWLILFLIVGDKFGSSFGITFLFLSPEYLGEVSGLSFSLLGFALGGFIIGFNTYSYIKIGAHYPFLTTISKPFYKFCVNNSLIPLAFVIFYLYRMIQFQKAEEFAETSTLFYYSLSFIAGLILFFIFSFFYFFPISQRNRKYVDQTIKPISSPLHKREKWYDLFRSQKDRTYIYIGRRFRLIASRSSKHFDKKLVQEVYAKNRISSTIFELLTIVIFFSLSLFSGYDIMEVPAATSIILLLTISSMIFSALHSWLKGWVYPLLVVGVLLMNFISKETSVFRYTSYAFGLDYSKKDTYSIGAIRALAANETMNNDSKETYIQMLENWKATTNESKPKLVIVNSSGGGSRSALWTMVVFQQIDKTLNNKLTKHTQMITGASGGMVGAAYYRELILRREIGEIKDVTSKTFAQNISKDMLNKLSFMASTNDILIRSQKCEFNGYKYTIERGYAFERQLHKNTDFVLDHSLGYYKKYEQKGLIPTMIFSPTIINDGRRLLISSQSLSFLTQTKDNLQNSYENIDIHALLSNQNTGDLRFSSVLRASATFPFVMPMVTIPTEPEIQLMDAGIRDNYGGKTTLEFIDALKDWIKENTSGVIIVQIRDLKKVFSDETYKQISFLDKLTLPFGNMYKNFPRVQDFNQEGMYRISSGAFEFPIDQISFNLLEKKADRISLSWHLTKQEKAKIHEAFYSTENQASLQRLSELLYTKK